MAETVRGINVIVGADTNPLERGLNAVDRSSRNLQNSLQAATGTLQQRMAALGTTLQNVGRTLTNVGMGMTAAITLPVAAAGIEIIKLASDAQEMQSKFATVFGDSAADAEAWAASYSDAAGRSQNAIMTMMGDFGSVLTGLGMSRDAAAEFSGQVVELAMDLGSFNNMEPEEAFDRISSAMRGESEAAESLGVAMNEVTIAAQMQSMGLQGQFADLDEVTKKQVLYGLIVSQSGDALGDAVKTAGSFANQMNALKGELADVGAELGGILLPYVTRLVTVLRDATAGFGQLSPGTQTAIIAIAAVAAAIGPLLIVVGMLISSVGTIMTVFAAASAAIAAISAPVLAVIAVAGVLIGIFVAMVAAVVNFIATNEEAQGKLGIIWAKIVQLVRPPFDALKAFWEKWGDEISAYFETMWNIISIMWETALLNIMDIVIFFLDVLTGDWEGAGQALRDIWSRTWAAIKNILSAAWGLIQPAFSSLYTSIQSWFTDLFTSALQWGENIVNNIADGIRAGIGAVGDAMSSVADTVSSYMPFSPAKEGALRDIMDFGPNITRMIADGIERGLPSLYDSMDQLSLVVAAPLTGSSQGAVASSGSTRSGNVYVTINKVSDYNDLVRNLQRKGLKVMA